MAKAKNKVSDVERDLIAGLEGFRDSLKAGDKIEKKYTVRRVVLDLEPQSYTAKQVKDVRGLLNVSQGVFAQLLGVSIKTVQKWEAETTPSDMACRFMDEICRNPNYWRKRLREAAKSTKVAMEC
jgi:putative transcriptional regulator